MNNPPHPAPESIRCSGGRGITINDRTRVTNDSKPRAPIGRGNVCAQRVHHPPPETNPRKAWVLLLLLLLLSSLLYCLCPIAFGLIAWAWETCSIRSLSCANLVSQVSLARIPMMGNRRILSLSDPKKRSTNHSEYGYYRLEKHLVKVIGTRRDSICTQDRRTRFPQCLSNMGIVQDGECRPLTFIGHVWGYFIRFPCGSLAKLVLVESAQHRSPLVLKQIRYGLALSMKVAYAVMSWGSQGNVSCCRYDNSLMEGDPSSQHDHFDGSIATYEKGHPTWTSTSGSVCVSRLLFEAIGMITG